ncbi:hypothetical protein JI739_19465 [Ramlibacter sp. AW1]|uniref:Uncharacterized protein n=1 Tax=Ramlibacter aurantiacus TaxID=2801330 RepID=A0A936ZXZ0_9BURK|nr:hypothetical protein [Ramlibacter aurantiacus]MBL0422534.1 hypothetical protein [Ramlibacter aurantiacus]
MRAPLGALLTAALAVSGCASSVYEGKYAWHDGWRKGKVVRVAEASQLGGRHAMDCRYKMGPQELAGTRFAVVAVRGAGRTTRAVVPLAAGSPEPASGDLVYANVRTCNASGLLTRSTSGSSGT